MRIFTQRTPRRRDRKKISSSAKTSGETDTKFKKDFKYNEIASELTNAYVDKINTLFDQTNQIVNELKADTGFSAHESRRKLLQSFDELEGLNKLLFDSKIKEKNKPKMKKLASLVERERTEFNIVEMERSAQARRERIQNL